jgi:hypothetical protein
MMFLSKELVNWELVDSLGAAFYYNGSLEKSLVHAPPSLLLGAGMEGKLVVKEIGTVAHWPHWRDFSTKPTPTTPLNTPCFFTSTTYD